MDCLIVGCGLTGLTAARTLAEQGKKVHIVERRDHVGGNIFDFRNQDGLLIQKYGPHSFFTDKKEIRDYIEQFSPVVDCFPEYVTMINGQALPMPFNFKAIDMLYEREKAEELKKRLLEAFPGKETVPVAQLVDHTDGLIAEYGRFMYENEYRLYTAKQWGRPIESISPAVFGRVPVYLSYKKEYQYQPYQFVPENGFTDLAQRMLDHRNISYELNCEALTHLRPDYGEKKLLWDGKRIDCPVIFTGALDELFEYRFGRLPYRSLEFIWKVTDAVDGPAAISAWPQAEKVTRVTDYSKLPMQKTASGKTVVAVELPFEYDPNKPFGNEPYYPINNDQTRKLYDSYRLVAEEYPDLFPAGRLAEYRYYNMDHAILCAKKVAREVAEYMG